MTEPKLPSPRPWKQIPDSSGRGGNLVIGADESIVANCWTDKQPGGTSNENAALIVHAVNHYPAAVEALRALVNTHSALHQGWDQDENAPPCPFCWFIDHDVRPLLDPLPTPTPPDPKERDRC